jgi:hypothetical protein
MTTYLILAASAILAVVIASLCIAWVARKSEPDRYEDGAQSDADVQHIVSSVRAPLETTRRVRGISS